ncbi:MAG: S-adenosylmethionine:tRNA ribosyltransferase-isomerase, partial [Rhodobacterales bacterium]|nr:S-adenosylmethionine:tRNA ribosyltransferase-isomerase [Rhodobacterales bacterium]
MRVDAFDFPLPPHCIAQRPAQPRDAARLLRVGPGGLADLTVRDLPGLLAPGDLLVVNDTRVIPARLAGRRRDARVEVTLHLRLDGATWKAFARPARKLKPGDAITFADGFAATVADKGEAGEVTLRFDRAGADLTAALEAHGAMPLPPYIKRDGL